MGRRYETVPRDKYHEGRSGSRAALYRHRADHGSRHRESEAQARSARVLQPVLLPGARGLQRQEVCLHPGVRCAHDHPEPNGNGGAGMNSLSNMIGTAMICRIIKDWMSNFEGTAVRRCSEVDLYRPGDLKRQYSERGYEEWEFLEF